jgi:hypothetical protein
LSNLPPWSALAAEATTAKGEETSAPERGPAAKNEPRTRIVDALHRGNHTTLTDALKAAQPADRILIRPGLYREGVVIDKPVEIIGDGELGEVVIEANGKNALLFQENIAPPVGALPGGDDICQRVGFPLSRVVENRAVDVIDRQDQVMSSKLFLPIEEALEFSTACLAPKESRRQNWDQKSDGMERSVDALLPLLAPGDVVVVPENREFFSGLQTYLAAQALAKLCQPIVLVLVVAADIAHKGCGVRTHHETPCRPRREGRLDALARMVGADVYLLYQNLPQNQRVPRLRTVRV